MLTAAKCNQTLYGEILKVKASGEIFEGEMRIRSLATYLLKIFCEMILKFQDIFKNMIYPDDNFSKNYMGCLKKKDRL